MLEYEALILGLKVVVVLKVKNLKVYGDSQLVINQANDHLQYKE